jgi:hypothetical protein
MKKIIITFLFLCQAFCVIHSVPLENWRHPFYRIAVEQDRISGSPSNMFWDDMLFADVMNSSLWPDPSNYSKNHWTLEPALFEVFSNDTFASGKNSNLHFDLLSNFRYGNFTVRTLLDVDQSNKKDPDYIWKTDRIAAGLIEEAYLQYTGKRGFIRLGRLKRNWGPFYDRSILLSNNPFAYDAFEWQFYTRFLEFRHLFSVFPRFYSYEDMDPNNKENKLDRYFVAHTLNFIFGKWASLGVSETVIFSRDNGFPDFQYINPFSIYSVLNTNAEGSANLMLGFQGWAHPFTEKITLKGQVVFDDFQVDNEDIMDQEPMHWACDFGIYGTDLLPMALNHHFSLEYRYLSKWMYTVTTGNTFKGERYTYLGRSLGYPDIDGDYFKGAITAAGKDYWAATVGMSINRQDTCTINTLWPSDTLGYTKEKPLSKRDSLATTLSFFINAHGYFRNFCALHLGFENRWIKKGQGNTFSYDPRITLGITAHYSNFFIKFKDK